LLLLVLVDLKLKLKEVEKASAAGKNDAFDRQAMESLLTKRFFIAPSFEIYGGVAGRALCYRIFTYLKDLEPHSNLLSCL
jgi:hypothetical protein